MIVVFVASQWLTGETFIDSEYFSRWGKNVMTMEKRHQKNMKKSLNTKVEANILI